MTRKHPFLCEYPVVYRIPNLRTPYTVYPETLTDPEKFSVTFSLDALLSRHSRFCYPLQTFALPFHLPCLA